MVREDHPALIPTVSEPQARRIDTLSVDRIVFAALLAVVAALPMAHRYLPLVDWPAHLSQDAIAGFLHDPRFDYARYYRLTGWFLPYQGFRWLHIALSRPFGILLGGRIALLGYLVGTPIAVAALARRLGRDRWVVIGSFTLLVEANFLWGFAPHATATTILLVGVSLLLDGLATGSVSKLAALSALGVVLFFTHAQQTALFVLTCAVVSVTSLALHRTSRRRTVAAIVSLVPAAGLLALYLGLSGWIDGRAVVGTAARAAPTVYRSVLSRWQLLPLSAGLDVFGRAPWYAFLAALLATSVGALASRRTVDAVERRSSAPWSFVGPTLFACWLGCTFLLPSEYRGQSIAPRIASLALLGALLALPMQEPRSLRGQYWLAPARVGVCVAAIASLAFAHVQFARFDRAMRPLDTVLAAIPERSRVIGLVYAPRPKGVKLPVLLHVEQYAPALRGGMASGQFTRTGIAYVDSADPRMHLVNETWMASQLGWQIDLDLYAPAYDFILVATGGHYPGIPFRPPRIAAAVRTLQVPGFELWRIDHRTE